LGEYDGENEDDTVIARAFNESVTLLKNEK
jgi:hypothetical protein